MSGITRFLCNVGKMSPVLAEFERSQESNLHSIKRTPRARPLEPLPRHGRHQPPPPPGGQGVRNAAVPQVLAQPHHARPAWHVQQRWRW